MNLRKFKQYLELFHYSGIDEIVVPKILSEEKRSIINPRNNELKSNDSKLSQNHDNEKGIIQFGDTNNRKEEKVIISSGEKIKKLKENFSQYKDCCKCDLCRNRNKFVYGEGNPDAKLMLIGEGPGAEENRLGHPFVGRAGQLLTKMLAAINLQREDVYITNVVKCQPPGNRNPLPDEVSSCLPYLWEQIDIIKPRLIVLLGRVAASSLLNTNDTLGKLREKKFFLNNKYLENEDSSGIETYVTYHPAALLRNPSFKKLSWIDLQKYRDILNVV